MIRHHHHHRIPCTFPMLPNATQCYPIIKNSMNHINSCICKPPFIPKCQPKSPSTCRAQQRPERPDSQDLSLPARDDGAPHKSPPQKRPGENEWVASANVCVVVSCVVCRVYRVCRCVVCEAVFGREAVMSVSSLCRCCTKEETCHKQGKGMITPRGAR